MSFKGCTAANQSTGMNLPQRKQMTFEDGAISYLEWEADAPVLHFAHANGFNAETYRSLLQPLAGKFHIYASDLRGHGFTSLPAVPGMQMGWNIYPEDLARFVGRIAKDRPVLLAGHSMGATSSLMLTAHRPELVRALVFAEPVLVPETGEQQSAEEPPRPNLVDLAMRRRQVFASFDAALGGYRGRGAFKTWPEEMLADYLRGGLVSTGNGSEMRLACTGEWEAANFRNAPPGKAKLVAEVRCPLTILHAAPGAMDGTARPSEIALVSRLKPDAKIVGVPDTTHFLPMERPDAVRAELLAFA
jgi:pimeloyl-ACP methyl ester carboxylesterase